MVPIAFRPIAVTTAALYRVVTPGESVFVKVLRKPRIPADLAEVVGEFPWRDEADFLLSDFELPPGMRRPRVVRVDDFGDRIALWLEDVSVADVSWDRGRLVAASFSGPKGSRLRVRYDGTIHELELGGDGKSRLALPQ